MLRQPVVELIYSDVKGHVEAGEVNSPRSFADQPAEDGQGGLWLLCSVLFLSACRRVWRRLSHNELGDGLGRCDEARVPRFTPPTSEFIKVLVGGGRGRSAGAFR